MAGCGIKVLQRKQTLLRLTDGMGDSFKTDSGEWVDACNPSQKICLEQDDMFEPNLMAGCGIKKAYDRPSLHATSSIFIHLLKIG